MDSHLLLALGFLSHYPVQRAVRVGRENESLITSSLSKELISLENIEDSANEAVTSHLFVYSLTCYFSVIVILFSKKICKSTYFLCSVAV